jgi:hypothetical protein
MGVAPRRHHNVLKDFGQLPGFVQKPQKAMDILEVDGERRQVKGF